MAFTRLETAAFAPPVRPAAPVPGRAALAQLNAPARRSLAIIVTIAVHIVLLKLLLAFAVAPKASVERSREARLLVFDTMGVSNSEAAAAPAQAKLVKVPAAVPSPQVIESTTEPCPWSGRYLELRMPGRRSSPRELPAQEGPRPAMGMAALTIPMPGPLRDDVHRLIRAVRLHRRRDRAFRPNALDGKRMGWVSRLRAHPPERRRRTAFEAC